MAGIPPFLYRRYARALYSLVPQEERKKILGELKELSRVLLSPEVRAFLKHPQLPTERKAQLYAQILEGLGISELLQRFTQLLYKKKRVALLPGIVETFSQLVQQAEGIAEGEGESSGELTREEVEAIRRYIEAQTGARVKLSFRVNPELIAGFRVRVGDRAWEGSLKNDFQLWQRKLEKRVAL